MEMEHFRCSQNETGKFFTRRDLPAVPGSSLAVGEIAVTSLKSNIAQFSNDAGTW